MPAAPRSSSTSIHAAGSARRTASPHPARPRRRALARAPPRHALPRGLAVVSRRLDPLGLVLKAGVWYLLARRRGEERVYRVSRIVSARERAGAVDAGGGLRPRGRVGEPLGGVRANAVVRRGHRPRPAVRRSATSATPRIVEDGEPATVVARFEGLDQAFHNLLAYGPYAEVLAPHRAPRADRGARRPDGGDLCSAHVDVRRAPWVRSQVGLRVGRTLILVGALLTSAAVAVVAGPPAPASSLTAAEQALAAAPARAVRLRQVARREGSHYELRFDPALWLSGNDGEPGRRSRTARSHPETPSRTTTTSATRAVGCSPIGFPGPAPVTVLTNPGPRPSPDAASRSASSPRS